MMRYDRVNNRVLRLTRTRITCAHSSLLFAAGAARSPMSASSARETSGCSAGVLRAYQIQMTSTRSAGQLDHAMACCQPKAAVRETIKGAASAAPKLVEAAASPCTKDHWRVGNPLGHTASLNGPRPALPAPHT